MKNKYKFAYKGQDGLWGLEESVEITQEDWDKFRKEMESMISCLKDFGEDFGFKDLGLTKGCIFDD